MENLLTILVAWDEALGLEDWRLRPSVQGHPFFGRRRRWSSEHHETDSAHRGPRAGVGGVWVYSEAASPEEVLPAGGKGSRGAVT